MAETAGALVTRSAIVGTWRISEMELWDQESIDLVGPAYIEFGHDGAGRFRFIAVEGQMDWRHGQPDGRAGFEFSWEGHDDCDRPAAVAGLSSRTTAC